MEFKLHFTFIFLIFITYHIVKCSGRMMENLPYMEYYKEAKMGLKELMTKNGYSVEEYNVTTRDGYILKLYHIPTDKYGYNNSNSSCTVFFVEALCTSSKIYFDNLDDSLGFNLLDAGCDIWAGEMRGTPDSRHVTYKRVEFPNNLYNKFWDFCIDEMGAIDAPAHIDYILKKTKKDSLIFIGYSRGNAVGFSMLASMPEMNKKISAMIALGPTVSAIYCVGVGLCSTRDMSKLSLELMVKLGMWQLPPYKILAYLLTLSFPKRIILTANNLIFGYDPYLLKEPHFILTVADSTHGISTRTLLQMFQTSIESRSLAKFDFGPIENMRRYNSTKPPIYDLNKITTPVMLLVGPNDPFGNVLDSAVVMKRLPNKKSKMVVVDHPFFQHADFMSAINGKKLVSQPILKFLKTVLE